MALVRMTRRTCARTATHLSGKFLAKILPLMEDIQQTSCATFVRE